MDAIIFTAGQQLCGFAGGIPSCAVRLCGRPLAEYQLEMLSACGITQCTFLMDQPAAGEGLFPERIFSGIMLRFLSPAQWLKSEGLQATQPLLVLDGRILCDFLLSDLVRAHWKSGVEVTAVVCGETGEKCGVYMVSLCAENIMPIMEKLGESHLQTAVWNGYGYWKRIDNVTAYQQAQMDLLLGKTKCRLRGVRDECGSLMAGEGLTGQFKLIPPVFIGEGVFVGEGATIGAGSILDDGCTVGAGAFVEAGILLPRSFIGERTRVRGGIVCSGAALPFGETLQEGAALQKSCCSAGASSAVKWDGEAYRSETATGLAPDDAVRLGGALGSLLRGKTVGVAVDGWSSSRVLADALIAGIRASGTHVLDFGGAFPALFRFGIYYNALPLGVCVRAGYPGSVVLLDTDGNPPPLQMRHTLESLLICGDYSRAPENGFGGCVDWSGIGAVYRTELLRLAPAGLCGMQVRVTSSNGAVQRLMTEALRMLGCVSAPGLMLRISDDGMKLSVSDGLFDLGWKSADKYRKLIQEITGSEQALEPRNRMHRSALSAQTENNGIQDGLAAAIYLLDCLYRRRFVLSDLAAAANVSRAQAPGKTACTEQSVVLLRPSQLYAGGEGRYGSLLDKERRNG